MFIDKNNEIVKQSALITGASRGIGKATARTLAENGYDLFLICKENKTDLSAFALDLSASYGVCTNTFFGDVSDPAFVNFMFDQIDTIDILINNAGISYTGLLQDMSDEDWNRIINTNLSSAFYTSRAALKKMVPAHSGKIINISSIWGEFGASCEVAYSASKGGLNAMTKALAKEVAASNIQVNAIAAGFIDTDMNSHLSDEEKAEIKDAIPADALGSPEDVASLVLNVLNSPSYMTGQVIRIDGGWM